MKKERSNWQQLALEDGDQGELQGPVGRPTSLGPPTTPLFSPEQLRDLHEVQSQAPHLYAKVPRESVWRPGGGAPQQSTTTGTPSPLPGQGHDPREPQRGRSPSQMKIELIYQINLRFKHEAMDRDTKNVMSSRDTARADHQVM